MIIAIFPNVRKRDSKNLALGIVEFLQRHDVQVVAEDEDAEAIGVQPISAVDKQQINFLISMGGDGTILRLAHKYGNLNAAILGINLGHLGFMADVPISDIYPSLQDLLGGVYTIENRIIIQGESSKGKKTFAINDFVIHRGQNPSLVEIAIHVDGLYLNTFEADGIILATPNGSTAYSLAAGGPIIAPSLEAFVITPISPHTISNRPIVLTSNQVIQMQYLSEYAPVDVIADGIHNFPLATGEVFSFSCSHKSFKLVNLLRRDYFSTLRTKLGWSGKLR
ncbi:MAG: NAD(+)/NADH kinase [Simkaniaceae bacterium]